MKNLWQFIYNSIFIPVFALLIRLASIFNKKIKRGIRGRKRIFEDLILNRTALNNNKKIIWFHSSSLGEFEQAKPIIEKLDKEINLNIIVSFYSPSGYDNSKKYPHADIITYMPLDTKWRAEKFINLIKPSVSVFMRYDIWPNHIWTLGRNNIPVFLVDATMKKKSLRKLPLIKSFHRYIFREFSKILTITSEDAEGFKDFGCDPEKIKVVGDTRFDRVYGRSLAAKNTEIIDENILQNKKVLVAGSTWEQDEDVLMSVFKKLVEFDREILLIIAPHEPTLLHLEKIENEFAGVLSTIRLSHIKNYINQRVIIVDSIGILSILYKYADVAFVGGSFKQNVHNVLEAAVYGIPVLFGPKIENSQEAKQLVETAGGMLVRGKKEMYRRLRSLFLDDNLRRRRGEKSFEYVQRNIGATEKIYSEIKKII
ncbi:MAG: 3-deoxy-D-manno-octulosonic acid transferase [Ignavibacteria bacterium]|nr:3-deoxy-D-manno-octulosonic acid transferase [Ignavibacteria bacterium]MBT8383019.1 3-deoxy-D-manno-octulosonic acid transferase [Ignavibacteria bacterium]MBT8391878.1 3-deoxy-D-manno-octulosonic acid transferase [Ignavibacteria bacterium]NNJ52967.1 3-deoxy-D-manno-octulosonic acid transferase [Ignavibacteriaceae bacterium]NNL21442.1 3-deoxy-D-manno-octulosonic acid transferase [Ignavibacteriaceae bacterium]